MSSVGGRERLQMIADASAATTDRRQVMIETA
jgi:hypothetical protein